MKKAPPKEVSALDRLRARDTAKRDWFSNQPPEIKIALNVMKAEKKTKQLKATRKELFEAVIEDFGELTGYQSFCNWLSEKD